MSGFLDVVKTLNSVVRTLLIAGVTVALGWGGWAGYRAQQAGKQAVRQREAQLSDYRERVDQLAADLALREQTLADHARTIGTLQGQLRTRDAEIDRLEVAMRLMTVDRRVARLTVVDQQRDPETGRLRSGLEFVELDPAGAALHDPRRFEFEGDVVFVDSWVVKFDDRYLQEADLSRGTSLVLFRRLFGEHQKPLEGFVLDEVGATPRVYGTGGDSETERQIWAQFWTIANDPRRADELGIRAAHGEAPSIRLRPGKSYLLQLRASDGLSIVVDRSGSTS